MVEFVYPVYCIDCGDELQPKDVAYQIGNQVQCWSCDYNDIIGTVREFRFENSIPEPYSWMK